MLLFIDFYFTFCFPVVNTSFFFQNIISLMSRMALAYMKFWILIVEKIWKFDPSLIPGGLQGWQWGLLAKRRGFRIRKRGLHGRRPGSRAGSHRLEQHNKMDDQVNGKAVQLKEEEEPMDTSTVTHTLIEHYKTDRGRPLTEGGTETWWKGFQTGLVAYVNLHEQAIDVLRELNEKRVLSVLQ